MSFLENAIKKIIADAIVEAYDRIKDGEQEIAPADGKSEESQPAQGETKRKRRTKAEIEAAARAEMEGVLNPPSTQPKAEPLKAKVSYETLSELILSHVTEHGSAKIKPVLAQFGVASAKNLQPEQWDECYELIKAVVDEAAEEIA